MTGPPPLIPSTTHVILSAAKNLRRKSGEILRCAQNDRRGNRPHYLLRAFTTMQLRRSIGHRSSRRAGRGGFSLLEMIIVVVVIGVMVTIAAPSYRRAVQQSRVDIAGANLRAIWAAERLFWLQNQTYTNDLSQLQALGLLDPKLPITDQTADNQYWDTYFWYTVTLGSTPNTFTANANVEPSRGTSNLQIDQTGTLQGNVTPCGSSAPITAVDFW